MAAFYFTAFLRKQSFEIDILSSSKKSEISPETGMAGLIQRPAGGNG
jgi:hypothetical protein